MDPKYDRDEEDLDGTVRNLRVLSDSKGELEYRRQVASGFDKISDRLGRIDVRLAKIDERLISRTTVAEIVKTEMAPYINDLARIEKILWGTIGTFFGTVIVTAVTILVTKALR
jgi:hypothetical protein